MNSKVYPGLALVCPGLQPPMALKRETTALVLSIPTIERFTLNSITIGSVKFLIAAGWLVTTVAPSTLEPITLNLVELGFSY